MHRKRRYGDPLGGSYFQGEPEKFARAAASSADEACIVWPHKRNVYGYGLLHHEGREKIASRFVCELVHGPPPERAYEASHSCANGPGGCVNGRHLRWATRKENAEDMVRDGGSTRGGRHGHAKLSDSDIPAIREAVAGGALQKDLAIKYGVHIHTISRVVRAKTFKNVA